MRRILLIGGLIACSLQVQAQAKKVGLVLSGGGSLGIAHIGVIRALEEHGIPIDCISGTSMGAMVGGFYAAGYSVDEMEEISKRESRNWLSGRLVLQENYTLQHEELDGTFLDVPLVLREKDQLLPENVLSDYELNLGLTKYLSPASGAAAQDFGRLYVPFLAVASDIYHSKAVVLKRGSLAFAIRASMAVPFFFVPASNDRYKNLYDGGVYSNFPVQELIDEHQPDYIIGVYVSNPPGYQEDAKETGSVLDMLFIQNRQEKTWQKLPKGKSLFIHPNLGEMSATDFTTESLDFAIQQGYDATIACMDEIKEAIGRQVDSTTREKSRQAFRDSWVDMKLDFVKIRGLGPKSTQFAERITRLKPGTTGFDALERAYYRMKIDGHYVSTFPELLYDSARKAFDLFLQVKPAAKFSVRLGGAFFSPTDHRLEAGATFYSLGAVNFRAGVDAGVGSFESFTDGWAAVQLAAKVPLYLQLRTDVYGWKYQQGHTGVVPSRREADVNQLNFQNQVNLGLNLRRGGRMYFGAALQDITWDYYAYGVAQTIEDTLDQTRYKGESFYFTYQVSSLNKRQYADEGQQFYINARYNSGTERYRPTNGLDQNFDNGHKWVQLRLHYQQYKQTLRIRGFRRLSLGFSLDAAYSALGDFSNEAATTLSSPRFTPFQDSPILYQSDYYSKFYVAPGLQLIGRITDKFSLRIEGHWMQRFGLKEKKEPDLSFDFSEKRLLATCGFNYDTFIGPIALFCNYFENNISPFRFTAQIGFVIFKKHPWD